MKILIACEESQTVCKAMRELGHEAYSADIQEPSGGHPEWHILGDVLDVLNPKYIEDVVTQDKCYGIEFGTMDGQYHFIRDKWDMIIAHPPCTYMSAAGACRMYPHKGFVDEERYKRALEAAKFFNKFRDALCDKVAIENPRPLKIVGLPKETQQIQPYQFGEPYSKLTYLWLRGLPSLVPTEIISDYKPYVSCKTSRNKGNKSKAGASRKGGAAKARSKTFEGIAKAMADQWAGQAEKENRAD